MKMENTYIIMAVNIPNSLPTNNTLLRCHLKAGVPVRAIPTLPISCAMCTEVVHATC
jgi:hypothetical protein